MIDRLYLKLHSIVQDIIIVKITLIYFYYKLF